MSTANPDPPNHPTVARLGAAAAVVALFALAAVPLILSGHARGRAVWDQDTFHLPTIRLFAAQWPNLDLRDYPSATTPGYHALLAAASRWISPDLVHLRLASAAVTAGMLWTLTMALARRVGPRAAFVLALPAACSLYVFSSGVWLLPDNAGWWGVLCVLLVALRPAVDWRTFALGGVALLGCVLMRQSHLWAAAVLWAAAWLGAAGGAAGSAEGGAGGDADMGLPPILSPLRLPPPGAMRRLAQMLLATAPALAAVAYFAWLWGGPIPPSLRGNSVGGNRAVPGTILSLLAGITAFFLGYLLRGPGPGPPPRPRNAALLAGALAGFVAGIVPASSYDYDAGRSSGLWNVVRLLPTYHDRSPLFLLLSTLGGLGAAAWALALPPRPRWILLAAWGAFIAAQSTNAMAWQRYYEPMILITAALGAAHLPPAPADAGRASTLRRAAPAGPILLAILLAATTFLSLR